MQKLNPIVWDLLEQRYQNNLLVEKLDDGGDLPFATAMRKGKARKAEDIGMSAVDWAYENVPGVKGMAQVEVPLSTTNKKEYEKLRSELAMNIVKARKKAFDEKESVDENEIFLRALSQNPELSKVLTRDEYESLAGDITTPLNLNIETTDDKGAKTSKQISIPKWGGIEDSSAMLYDFLRGAQQSLTTPEGLLTGAAFGAGFRGLGMAAQGVGKIAGPAVAKYIPGAVKTAAKVTLPSVGKARTAAEAGQAIGQSAVNIAGLGLMGAGALGAAQEGKFSRFAGELAGGVAPFAAGSKATEVAVPAAIKGAPIAYQKGKEIAGDIKDVAKGTGESIAQAAQKVGSDIAGLGRELKDIPWSELGTNIRAGIKEILPSTDFSYNIRRVSDGGFKNLTPAEQIAAWRRGEGTWTTGQETSPYFEAGRSSTSPRPEAPTTKPKAAAAAATAAAVLGGAVTGGPGTMRGAEVPTRAPGIVSVEPAARGVGGPTVETSRGGFQIPKETGGPKAETGSTKPSRSSGREVGSVGGQTTTKMVKNSAVSDTGTKDVNLVKGKQEGKNKTSDSESDQTTNQADQTIDRTNADNQLAQQAGLGAVGGGKGGGSGEKPPAPPEKGKELPGKGGVPGFGMGGMPMGGNQLSDYELKRQMAGTDINAILQNLFQTARTVTIG